VSLAEEKPFLNKYMLSKVQNVDQGDTACTYTKFASLTLFLHPDQSGLV
jgi:hypothetical protein